MKDTIQSKIVKFAEQYPAEVIVFLGAGASVCFDMPLMNQFFSEYFRLEKTTNSQPLDSNSNYPLTGDDLLKLCMRKRFGHNVEKADLEDVLDYLIKINNSFNTIKPEYHEEIIKIRDTLELAITATHGPSLIPEEGISGLLNADIWNRFFTEVASSVQSLTRNLYRVYGPAVTPKLEEDIYHTYGPFFEIIRQLTPGNIMIFTTNYDPCLDIFLYNKQQLHHRIVSNGFSGTHATDIKTWNIDNYFLEADSKIIASFNLHGSVLWRRENNTWVYNDPMIPVIIPPNEGVALEAPVIGKGKVGLCKFVKMFFKEILTKSPIKYFITVGYSYRDPDIFEQVKEAVDTKSEMKFVYLTPSGNIPKEFGKSNTNFIPIKCHFGGFDSCQKIQQNLNGRIPNLGLVLSR